MICTNCDATLDNVINTILNILDQIEPYIDPIVVKYTGYTIAELKFMCAEGIQLIKML